MPEQGQPTIVSPPVRKRRRGATGLWILFVIILLVCGVGFAGLALTGKALKLPVWAVAEAETRLNRVINQSTAGLSISIGTIELMVDPNWMPRVALEDVRILQTDGNALMTLPEVRASFDLGALATGALHPNSVKIIGGSFAIKRNQDGRFDFDLGKGTKSTGQRSVAEVLDSVDKVFNNPAFRQLSGIEAEALALQLTDARTGQLWQAGDGLLVLENRPKELAAQLSLSLGGGHTQSARVVLTSVSEKASSAARLSAKVDGLAAKDLAAQSVSLAWLSALDAPISGLFSADLDEEGRFGQLESKLELGAGVLRPTPETAPIAFDRAGFALSYIPEKSRINISALSVESRSLRFSATGQSYILDQKGAPFTGDLAGQQPGAFLTQIAFSQVKIDPAGLFQAPAEFSEGAVDLRLTLKPFAIDIGQLTLTEAQTHVSLEGSVNVDPKGWKVALDVMLDQIEPSNLIALWPPRLVSKTRDWLARNVLEGTLFNVKAAVRLAPEKEPRLSLGYEFKNTDVRFLKALPPVRSGSGYSNIEGRSYTLVLEKGHVTPPVGGEIDVTGTVFKIADISLKPTVADITLRTQSSLTAALSLLDQPPFGFLTKAKRPVDLGRGKAILVTKLSFPLKPKVLLEDVVYSVSGQISDFQSESLLPGRLLSADLLSVVADKGGLNIAGKGLLDTLPFDATFKQAFGPAAKGRSIVEAKVQVSDPILRDFKVVLPKGMITGSGMATAVLDLVVDQPAQLSLTSDLLGLALDLPALGWSKSAKQKGNLQLEAILGKVPEITSLSFDAAGLAAKGRISLEQTGGLKSADFDRVQLDNWLDAPVTLTGRGQGRAVGVSIASGSVDLRQLAVRRSNVSGADDGPLQVQLDRLQVSDGIALTDFNGDFSSKGGFNGSFTASVNGAARVAGTVVPSPAGSAVRIKSDDAGLVMKAAAVFADARGGSLDLQLVPTAAKGEYQGRARIGTLRVQNASVLAELLSAISVVGLLEKLNGSGLVFNQAEADFRLTPDAVEVTRGSAIGASLGVSLAGIYESGSKTITMQGVVSPIYLLNGVGSVLARKGEGLFGFSFKIRGTADAPVIKVNPLSILTPGLFRKLFGKPAPVLPKGNG